MSVTTNVLHGQPVDRVALGATPFSGVCVLKCSLDKSRQGGCAALPSLRSTGPVAPPVPSSVAPRRPAGTGGRTLPVLSHGESRDANTVLMARDSFSPGQGQTRVNRRVPRQIGFDMPGASILTENSLPVVITQNMHRLKRLIEPVYTLWQV